MKKRILVLGITGMLGNTMFSLFTLNNKYFETFGTLQDKKKIKYFSKNKNKIYVGYSVKDFEKFNKLIQKIKPNYVINCKLYWFN